MVYDPFEVLLAHDAWANRNLLQACLPLTPEQFHRRFEMGVGSLHDTVTHIIGAMRRWTDLLEGREMRPRIETDGQQRTPAELLVLLEEALPAFDAAARVGSPDGTVSRSLGGKTYTFPRGGVVTHVVTHAMHHRAQCLNMLRHVGVTPLPASSVLDWMMIDHPPR